MRIMTTTINRPVIAIHALTGALEQYSSIRGACVALRSMNISATEVGIRKACNGFNLKYRNRYWEFVE